MTNDIVSTAEHSISNVLVMKKKLHEERLALEQSSCVLKDKITMVDNNISIL